MRRALLALKCCRSAGPRNSPRRVGCASMDSPPMSRTRSAPSVGFAGDAPPFRVSQVSHQASRVDAELAAAAALPAPPAAFSLDLVSTSTDRGVLDKDSAASCNADMNCYPDWLNAKRSVAHIQ